MSQFQHIAILRFCGHDCSPKGYDFIGFQLHVWALLLLDSYFEIFWSWLFSIYRISPFCNCTSNSWFTKLGGFLLTLQLFVHIIVFISFDLYACMRENDVLNQLGIPIMPPHLQRIKAWSFVGRNPRIPGWQGFSIKKTYYTNHQFIKAWHRAFAKTGHIFHLTKRSHFGWSVERPTVWCRLVHRLQILESTGKCCLEPQGTSWFMPTIIWLNLLNVYRLYGWWFQTYWLSILHISFPFEKNRVYWIFGSQVVRH